MRHLATVRRGHAKSPFFRYLPPVDFLLGTADVRSTRDTPFNFVIGTGQETSSATFYLLALVARARGDRDAESFLLSECLETGRLNGWATILARLDEGSPSPDDGDNDA